MEQLDRAIARQGLRPLRLPSGAGHDAMALAALCPIAMLFVRCGGGISHNPLESITAEDAETAARVFLDFLAHSIGRASCRESVCQYGWLSLVALSLKQNN